jgi:hypothetical protein
MRAFTPEDVAHAKALSKVALGREHVERISVFFLDEEVEVLVRPLSVVEYGEHLDTFLRSSDDANGALLVDAILWPSQAEVARIVGDHPAFPDDFGTEFRRMMGVRQEVKARIVPLASATPAQLERAGLDKATAAELLTSGGRPHLLTLAGFKTREDGPDVAIVLRSPSASLYGAHGDRMAAVQKAGKGVLALAIQTARDIWMWSREPLEAYLDALPGMFPADISQAFLDLGGSGARRERKRL